MSGSNTPDFSTGQTYVRPTPAQIRETYQIRLQQAEEAYHLLNMGQNVVTYKDQNGETVTYSAANIDRLAAYIAFLKSKLGIGRGSNGPIERIAY